MSTCKLEVQVTEDHLDWIRLRPAFIDYYRPRFARGQVAAGILDHVSVLSRIYNTWVIRRPGENYAWVLPDTTNIQQYGQTVTDTLLLEEEEGYFISKPVQALPFGYLTQIVPLDFGQSLEVRLGRNILWWGNMEDEGAGFWDINSSQEGYDREETHGGQRSLLLEESNGGTVYNYFWWRAPLQGGHEYTFSGWLKTENSASAATQMRYYTSRTQGGTIATEMPGGETVGTHHWQRRVLNLDPPENATFYSIRHSLTASGGQSRARFDDEELIQWDDWIPLPAGLPLPSDYHYFQVRAVWDYAIVPLNYTCAWVDSPDLPDRAAAEPTLPQTRR